VETQEQRSKARQRAEGFKTPLAFSARSFLTEDVEVAVIGSDLEESVVGPVPLVKNLLNYPQLVSQVKPYWSLVRLASGIAFHAQLHLLIVMPKRSVEPPSIPKFLRIAWSHVAGRTGKNSAPFSIDDSGFY
jgi:hypothetical protein